MENTQKKWARCKECDGIIIKGDLKIIISREKVSHLGIINIGNYHLQCFNRIVKGEKHKVK